MTSNENESIILSDFRVVPLWNKGKPCVRELGQHCFQPLKKGTHVFILHWDPQCVHPPLSLNIGDERFFLLKKLEEDPYLETSGT